MPKFIKKPVIIEARLLDPDADYVKIAEWCGGIPTEEGCRISTLEGILLANFGDWIIKGVKGEFYPCKPDIFELTYRQATIAEIAKNAA